MVEDFRKFPCQRGESYPGVDHEKERSNGSGKSSFLRTIPFALFGKTHKNPIKKENIVNWKNRKNCEVFLNFTKNGTKYTFFRGIRPDVLEIYENGRLLPTPPDARAYQKTIENEILNIDFQTFMSLIYTNLNDMTPLLQMDKTRKRQFLETIFNLQYFSELVNKANLKIKTTSDRIYTFQTSIEYTDKTISELEKQNDDLRQRLTGILSSERELSVEKDALRELHNTKQSLKEINETEIRNQIEQITKEWKILAREIQQGNSDLSDKKEALIKEIHKIDILLTEARTNLKNADSRKKDLEGKTFCPTCETEISSGNILEKIQVKSQAYQTKIDELKEQKKNTEDQKKTIIDEIKKWEEEKQAEADRKEKEIETLEKNLSRARKQNDKIKTIDDEIREAENKIKILEERISHETKAREELQSMEQKNQEKIESLGIETRVTKKKINQLKDILDYLEHIKVLCKDENVKQYAISAHVPKVNEKTNKYLAEGGMNFYIKFDNWLDAEIKGPGIYGCTYENLSGGEMRSVDLALQFAFLDIARVQATMFPDIMITDEIFDSSIDSDGLTDIMRIIKAKQMDDQSKVFLVTHRQEVDVLDADGVYLVEKTGGFSTIIKT